MSLVLALDQSTSGTKAILFDRRGKILDQSSRPHRQIYPRPGWVEHDAEEIWRNVLALIKGLVSRHPKLISKIICFSLANQRETVVIFNRKTGQPLHHALVWQDRRGDAICAKLVQAGMEKTVRAKTGLRVDTYFSASKIRWLAEKQPGLSAKLKSGEALIGTMDAFLIYRLTQGKVFATDFTNASRTLLFDIHRLKWDAALCAMFRAPLAALPELRESTANFGETDAQGLLPRRIPITGVMGDSQASLFAQQCYQPGTGKVTIGTGSSVLLNIGHRPVTGVQGAVTSLAWVIKGRPTYALEGIINFSAATLEWLRNQIGMIKSAREAETLANSVPDNAGVYLVPAFAGLSAPHWSPDARAAILGMTAFTTRAHIVRAAIESIAYQLRDVLDMMRAEAGMKPRGLCADGGATRNEFLMQFTADITRAELKVSELAESSAWGAALNGLLGRGIYDSLPELSALHLRKTMFRPAMPPRLSESYYAGWQKAVRRTL
jgi:glycerol kinase